MEKIASFMVDHRLIRPGVYISRIDGDITTYDMRTRIPNSGDLMDHATIHSFEHLFATFARNSEIQNDVIYFGPMGCQTGFYLLVRNADNTKVINIIKHILCKIINYNGEMPGGSEIECGNYRNLNIAVAQVEARKYYEGIKNITISNLEYPKADGGIVGIIGAMNVEVEGLKAAMTESETETVAGVTFFCGKLCGRRVVVAVSGIGKVNAAMCTQSMILKYNPNIIVSTGVAGGHPDLNIGDVVVSKTVVQHDMDTTAIGDEPGFINGIDMVHIPCSRNLAEKMITAIENVGGISYKYGVIATGDRFIGNTNDAAKISEQFDASAYEMESGSIGQVCYINGVEYIALRAISDNGDEEASVNFTEFTEMSSERNIKILKKFLLIN